MTPCPSKRSHINPGKPPRVCYETCARYEYAAHLTGGDWIKPGIDAGRCPNHVPRVIAQDASGTPSSLV